MDSAGILNFASITQFPPKEQAADIAAACKTRALARIAFGAHRAVHTG
jgi:hypothetical protein